MDYFENDRKAFFTEGVRQEKGKFSWDKMTGAIIEVYEMHDLRTLQRSRAWGIDGKKSDIHLILNKIFISF